MHSLMMSSDDLPRLRSVFSCIFCDDELLVQGAAVHADAYRLVVLLRDLADRGELLIAPTPGADVAGVDPVLVEGPRAVGVTREQKVSVVMEIADKRSRDACVEHPALDLGNGFGSFWQVDRDTHHFGPGFASSMHCCAVAAASAVSVMVIDWTTTGAPPPTWTGPTRTPTVL